MGVWFLEGFGGGTGSRGGIRGSREGLEEAGV